MAATVRIALTGDVERLLACAPELDTVELVPSGQPPSDDTELAIALGVPASAPEADAPPTVVWLDAGEQPSVALRACDRLIATDPQTAGAWRTLPLPVADASFMPPPLPPPTRGVRWIGPGGARREELLCRHAGAATWPGADALSPTSRSGAVMDLVDVTGGDVAVNLPEQGRGWVTHELALALASGCLLVSETLSPALGLEPGVDYLEARDPDDLFIAAENALRRPHAFRRIQLAGRRKAEWFRSSTQLERIAHDLRRESAAAS